MAFTKVQIVSRAFTLIGKGSVISLDNPDPLVQSASDNFDMMYESSLCDANWRFATGIQQLSLLNESPVVDRWKYIYALPSNFLKFINIYPRTYDFELYANKKLYTNSNNPKWMEFIFQPDITLVPSYFSRYLIWELAAFLATSNAQVKDLTNYLDSKAAYFKAVAMANDAQNRPQTALQSNPLSEVRYVGSMTGGA